MDDYESIHLDGNWFLMQLNHHKSRARDIELVSHLQHSPFKDIVMACFYQSFGKRIVETILQESYQQLGSMQEDEVHAYLHNANHFISMPTRYEIGAEKNNAIFVTSGHMLLSHQITDLIEIRNNLETKIYQQPFTYKRVMNTTTQSFSKYQNFLNEETKELLAAIEETISRDY